MDDKELLQFYTSGADLNILSDTDLQRLGKLMKVGEAKIGPDTTLPIDAGRPGSSTPPSMGLTKPGQANTPVDPSKGSIGDIPGKEFVQGLLGMLLKGGMIGAGLGPESAAVRTALETVLGGAEGFVNPPEGESRLASAGKGAALQGGMEGIASKAAEAAPWLGDQAAIRLGTSPNMRPGNKTREYVDAFLRQRQREGFGNGVPVGKSQASILPKIQERTIRPTPIRSRLNGQMDDIKASLPEKDLNFDNIRKTPSKLRDPEKFLGLSAPADTAGRIAANDDAFWSQNKGLIDFMNGSGGPNIQGAFGPAKPADAARSVPAPEGSLTGDVPYFRKDGTKPTNISFGDAVEISQRQGKEAAPVFDKMGMGKWVRASDTPEQQAAKERKAIFQKAAEDHARSKGPEGNAVADKLVGTNAALSDQYKIEEIMKALRKGLMFASIRGGVGAGVGGGLASLTGGDVRTGSAIGGIGGLIGHPANLSRAGNLAGRVAEVGPTAERITDLTGDMLGGLDSLSNSFAPKNPVKRRDPK